MKDIYTMSESKKVNEVATVNAPIKLGFGTGFLNPIAKWNGKELPSSRELVYIAMFATTGNLNHLDDSTKGKAGLDLAPALSAIPDGESVIDFYLPKSEEVRDSASESDWMKVLSVKASVMLKAAELLATTFTIMESAKAEVKTLAESAVGFTAVNATMPAWMYKSPASAGKRAGGNKATALTSIFKA